MRNRFPMTVKRGSVAVKIYQVRHKSAARGFVYAVSYNVGPRRFLPQFVNLETALAEARQRADELAAGRHEAASFARHDAEELKAARRLVGDVPMLSALQEWAKARELTAGNVLAAAELWKGRNTARIERKKVCDVVEEFTTARTKAGFNVATDHASIFRAIKEALGDQIIDAVSARQITAYLEKRTDAVSRNTHRKRIVSIWRWAKKQGYLPRDTITEAEQTERAREGEAKLGIISAASYGALLEHFRSNVPCLLPSLILAGFCGLRRNEIHAQQWEDIDLAAKLVRVSNAKRGTPARRFVPLSDAAVEWLLLCADRKGPITYTLSLDRIRLLAREAKFTLPENCFRHAFISHRVAQTGNIAEVSLEAGNSPAIIRRHYLELVKKTEGEAWFSITPRALAPIKSLSEAG